MTEKKATPIAVSSTLPRPVDALDDVFLEVEDVREKRSKSVSARFSPKNIKRRLGRAPSSPLASPNNNRRGLQASQIRSLVRSPSPTFVKTKLHHFNAQDIAEELCRLDSEFLRKIKSEELKNGVWMKKDLKHKFAWNVLEMVKFSNELAMLIPTEILAENTPHTRAKVISVFISVCNKCYKMHNYNSLKALLSGLQCTPVYRLKKTWKEVPTKKKKKYEALTKLMSEERNWGQYRAELKEKLSNNIQCIPFLGVLLTTIVQQDSVQAMPANRRRCSGVEDYVLLEAITVRNRLEKIRRRSSNLRHSMFPTEDSRSSIMEARFSKHSRLISPFKQLSLRNSNILENDDDDISILREMDAESGGSTADLASPEALAIHQGPVLESNKTEIQFRKRSSALSCSTPPVPESDETEIQFRKRSSALSCGTPPNLTESEKTLVKKYLKDYISEEQQTPETKAVFRYFDEPDSPKFTLTKYQVFTYTDKVTGSTRNSLTTKIFESATDNPKEHHIKETNPVAVHEEDSSVDDNKMCHDTGWPEASGFSQVPEEDETDLVPQQSSKFTNFSPEDLMVSVKPEFSHLPRRKRAVCAGNPFFSSPTESILQPSIQTEDEYSSTLTPTEGTSPESQSVAGKVEDTLTPLDNLQTPLQAWTEDTEEVFIERCFGGNELDINDASSLTDSRDCGGYKRVNILIDPAVALPLEEVNKVDISKLRIKKSYHNVSFSSLASMNLCEPYGRHLRCRSSQSMYSKRRARPRIPLSRSLDCLMAEYNHLEKEEYMEGLLSASNSDIVLPSYPSLSQSSDEWLGSSVQDDFDANWSEPTSPGLVSPSSNSTDINFLQKIVDSGDTGASLTAGDTKSHSNLTLPSRLHRSLATSANKLQPFGRKRSSEIVSKASSQNIVLQGDVSIEIKKSSIDSTASQGEMDVMSQGKKSSIDSTASCGEMDVMSQGKKSSTDSTTSQGEMGVESQGKKSSTDSTASQGEMGVESQRKKFSTVSIPEDEPPVQRARRRASNFLSIALATSEKCLDTHLILVKYQISALGFSKLTPREDLRQIICTSYRNSEAQNYKQSYEVEPQ